MIETIFPSIPAVALVTALALLFGLLLSVALRLLRVKKDPRVERVLEALPGANCGACGMPGCSAYATRIVEDKFAINLCPVGGDDVARKIADVMEVAYGGGMMPLTARVHCRGGRAETTNRFEYSGPRDCGAANGTMGGFKTCRYGCLGFGDCERACPFGAITMSANGLPVVNAGLCTGCGLCVAACPRAIISLTPRDNDIYVMCINEEKAPVMKQGCSVGCIACKLCEKACREALAARSPGTDPATIVPAITVTNFCAHIDYDICIQCYRCVYVCPVPVINPLEKSKKYLEKSGSKKEQSPVSEKV
ncbi:MAG TPA: RnfABCDGE type electron transport complex subunit B [Spirochaetota bacterium]|nr:RnfABCDGE type electron transport complex subunit B [Spirochaetota bacterium]HOD15662.1 RnfABCDGE type electron transport complex subunit B [Spirochaetota bacterium]HPG51485.1 RnfABCDGE type electron transport complex subunit B [Spirochaetota bacterium]HPN13727.1 RnfABCDGE type electron transport complex subunit B [Spirochaetota bacterium]